MTPSRRCARALAVLSGALSVLALPAPADAQVKVTPTVTYDGLLYHYDYSVANSTLDPLAIVTVRVPALAEAVLGLTAPGGFLAVYDPGLALVSFLEDADEDTAGSFAPGSAVSGFAFKSALGPGATDFEAIDARGRVFRGGTVGPVPEPGSVTMALALGAGVVILRLRARLARV